MAAHSDPPSAGRTGAARHPALIPLVAVLLVTACSLPGGFILDDWFLLERAGRPSLAEALRFAIHVEDYGIVLWPLVEPVRLEFLRPLTMLTFRVEETVWGLRAAGYHLDNIALHLLNVLLLLSLARRWGLSRVTAGLVAVAWGLSLAAVPAVGWISGRTELLCGASALGAVLCFDAWITGGRARAFAGAVLFAALAPLAKETGVAVPLLVLIAAAFRRDAARAPASRRIGAARVLLLGAPALIYVAVRFLVLHVPAPRRPYLDPLDGGLDRLWLALKPVLYAFTALFTLPLSHLSPLTRLHDHPLWMLVPAVAAGGALVWLARRIGARTVRDGAAWFLAALLPSLPVLPTTLYLYTPLMGFALLLGFARDARPRSRIATAWLAAWILVGAGFHVVTAVFTRSAAASLRASAETAARRARDSGAARLLLVDTPVWAYGLPAAIRLRDPDLRLESWILNFAPGLRPGAPSRLERPAPLDLAARSASGAYFASPIERFLLFGAAPEAPPDRPDAPLRVEPVPPIATPPELRVRFRDLAARDGCAVLQFRDGRAVPVEIAEPEP